MNPVIGEIRLGIDCGKKETHTKFIYQACIDCGEPRWVQYRPKKQGRYLRCLSCLGKHKSFMTQERVNRLLLIPPILGEVRTARECGKKGHCRYIYHACTGCGKERWVLYKISTQQPINVICLDCWIKKCNTSDYTGTPKLGEIRKGREIGKKDKTSYIWYACIKCGKERWVPLRNGAPRVFVVTHVLIQ